MFDWISILPDGMLQVNFPRRTGAELTCDTFETTERRSLFSLEPVVRFVSTMFGGLVAAKSTLDVNALSDHIKRDMGFMDGRGSHEDDEVAMAESRRLFSIDELPRI